MQMRICGEGFTSQLRDLVLSDNYRGAYELMKDDLGMTSDQAISFMKGERLLRNCEDDPTQLELCEAASDDEAANEYRETLRFQTCGVFRYNARLYRPRAFIDIYTAHYWKAMLKTKDSHYGRAKGLLNESDLLLHVKMPGQSHFNAVIFEVIEDIPLWVTCFKKADDALADFIDGGQCLEKIEESALRDIGMVSKSPVPNLARFTNQTRPPVNRAEQQKREEEQARTLDERDAAFGEEVRKQAKHNGGFFNMEVYSDSKELVRVLKVPRIPFECWALKGTGARALGIMPEWRLICPMELKMRADDPMHSDWWFGAGLTASDYQRGLAVDSFAAQINTAAFHAGEKVRKEKLTNTIAFLSGKGRASGRVVHLEPGQAPEAGEIGIIEHAGPEYTTALEAAARHGTALITLVGGPLTHLATVAREGGVMLAMWSEAEHIKAGKMVYLDAEDRTINLPGF